ncbi:hypothetical protein POSPLADRAFT_1182165 [Postia placenta MAD-698-R-SB12]|uniref:N-acetyltransferase domain-containing protein n=1 Tax=Postia placenta MAD-698-R-SB12 TaxID=670580 RepID=A0A1X6MXK7_9APHY|nr:hypothetical protein POSPLADRAFT_1182165 [Postia placenta MAD-698-R-SB12]OSX60992.1 hypothetical protein POSPLADRAFT_1182165 [Postia placenta MAD-698-R-SB12]
MSEPGYFIRQATVEDVVWYGSNKVVAGTATYEKAPEMVKATPELLRKNLFETPYAHTLLAVTGTPSAPGKAIGMAMYFYNYSTWTGRPGLYLEDLFVDEAFRGKGIGKAFFAELGKIAKEKNCARMDWSVLDWNQPSRDFYEKKLGAKPMTSWIGMRLEEEGIDKLASLAS